ncbi:MAG: hypothetical protein KDD35_07725, partial [Bdellovibrionales bacterium]|nr:hypothetical protein [Bdellovibrionales bacterium]
MFSPQVLKIILFFPFGLFLSLKGERACAAPIVVETRMENFEALRAGQKVVGLKEVEIRVRNFLSQFDIDFEQYRLLSKEDPRVSEVLTSDELKAWMEKKPIKVMA